MIPNAAKTRSSHDNQPFSVDGKATRRKVKPCYRKWLGYVVTMIWNICHRVSWSVAYRYSVGLSAHALMCPGLEKLPAQYTVHYCTVTVQDRVVIWVKLGFLRCGLFQMCCAIKWRISVSGSPRLLDTRAGGAFKINTDAGDWEHWEQYVGQSGNNRCENTSDSRRVCRWVHNAEKTFDKILRVPIRELCVGKSTGDNFPKRIFFAPWCTFTSVTMLFYRPFKKPWQETLKVCKNAKCSRLLTA